MMADKNPSHFINISDIVTQVVPLNSVYQAPIYEPNITLLAPFSMTMAHLSMLYILELACVRQLKNK